MPPFLTSAREVLDSRGNPTVEVEVHYQSSAFGRAIPEGLEARIFLDPGQAGRGRLRCTLGQFVQGYALQGGLHGATASDGGGRRAAGTAALGGGRPGRRGRGRKGDKGGGRLRHRG